MKGCRVGDSAALWLMEFFVLVVPLQAACEHVLRAFGLEGFGSEVQFRVCIWKSQSPEISAKSEGFRLATECPRNL